MKHLICLSTAFIIFAAICGCDTGPSDTSSTGTELSTIEGTSNVAVDSKFLYTFSTNEYAPTYVNTSTVTTSTFFIVNTQQTSLSSPYKASYNTSVCDSGTALPATVSCSSARACTLSPTNNLSTSTSYTACLKGGANGIRYQDGSYFAGASYQFTTASGGGTEGGTVTLSGTLSLTSSPSINKDISFASSASGYIINILNTATGGQESANVASDGTFSLEVAANKNYIINIMNSDKRYVGTLMTDEISNNTVPVALTTGADESTTALGTVTANTTTGQVTSDQTLTADPDQLAYTSGTNIAGGNSGEGTTSYRSETGITCTASAVNCPDYDGDGNPDIFDTNNDNDSNGYADEITGAVDLCVPGTVALYVENYPTSGAAQQGFPTPAEVDADLGGTTMYQIHLEFTPTGSYTMSSISQVAVTTPAYIDSYGYVYHVTSGHACFNTLWTDCNGKKLLTSTDGTKYEMALADINLTRAGVLENMFPGDTFILNILTTDGTTHVCTRKINIIPKYYPYAFKKDGTAVSTDSTQTSWSGTLNFSWTIPSAVGPAGMTYAVRVVPFTACSTWDADNYTEFSAGQDATSISITNAELPSSPINYWSFYMVARDTAGDVTQTGQVRFTSAASDPCP